MIPYHKTFLNFGLIFRINGSPIYRAIIPSLISTFFYIYLESWTSLNDGVLNHPYGVGVLISSISLIIAFRANYGYQRYWGACGSVHHMSSKWLDAVTHTGVFHMQQSHYNNMKPPSYWEHHDLNFLNLKRDREVESVATSNQPDLKSIRAVSHSIEPVSHEIDGVDHTLDPVHSTESDVASDYEHGEIQPLTAAESRKHLMSRGRLDGGWGLNNPDNPSGTFFSMSQNENTFSDKRQADKRGFASERGGRTPTLFLQELVHLASLCNAVAYSTLRNDIDGSTSPLAFYKPGSDWPNTDPDQDEKSSKDRFWDPIKYILGMHTTPATRAKHNFSRPLPVLGGVSPNEIKFLQKARGPSAKVTLAWHWLSEFIIREHLAGSLGKVGPPIISRLIQFLSDGMIYYNHSRKTMFIPFPFPHAQISAFFMFVIMFAVPLLMDEYSNNSFLGAVLTFLTVACITGLHEVARELENPFRNVPNEIPLCTLQAMFNESLITLFAGYHPDHYWDPDKYRERGPQAAKEDPNLMKEEPIKTVPKEPNSFSQLQKVVIDQQKEIARLSALIEGKNPSNGTCETL